MTNDSDHETDDEISIMWLCRLPTQYILHGSDQRSLHRNIPPSVLPEEYGGIAGHLDLSAWSTTLQESEEEFIVEFCQPDPLEGAMLQDSMLYDGDQASGQDDDTFRGLRSQLYYCYWHQLHSHRWEDIFCFFWNMCLEFYEASCQYCILLY